MPLYGQDQASLGVKSALLAYFYWALVRSKDVPEVQESSAGFTILRLIIQYQLPLNFEL